jgi:mannose-6-phosphate isomerase
MEALDNPIRPYAWGSRTTIARLQGRPAPAPQPEAELWMGAHPDSPSVVRPAGGGPARPLTEVIAADPARVLGPDVVDRFGARLPYLFKVLAAAAPLSLQAHPDAARAAAGYAAEEAAGAAPGAPGRNYRDPYHKPELLVAVEEFDALCGFRDPARSADLLAALDVPGLKPTVEALRIPDAGAALRGAVTGLLCLQEPAPLVDAVAAAARSRADEPTYALAVDLAGRYPGDVGVVVAMLLNHVCLAPGEAVWMPPGNLHAYLRGTGVEIMASSDNVLRGGLTPKHVDVPELLKVLRFEVLEEPVVRPRPVGPGGAAVVTWPAPADEFALYRAEVDGGEPLALPGHGPRILLCLRGEVRADDGEGAVTLGGGRAAFARAGHPVTVTGHGVVYQAGLE